MKKTHLQSIEFSLFECPAPLLTARPFTIWAAAELAILGTVQPNPDFFATRIPYRITWDDGETCAGHLPLTGQTATFNTPLARHVRESLQFLAGRRPLPGMSATAYWVAFCEQERFTPGTAERASRLLDAHEIGCRSDGRSRPLTRMVSWLVPGRRGA
jgi:hypothetical protein